MEPNTNTTKNYAGIWIRTYAIIIDIIIWNIPFTVLTYLLSLYGSINIYSFVPNLLWELLYIIFVNGLIFLLATPYLISTYGGSLGKILTGLKIENTDGTTLTYKQALFREYIGKFASGALFGIGYFWIAKTEKKQGWHDMLSDTVVLKKSGTSMTGSVILTVFILAAEIYLMVISVNVFRNNKQLINGFLAITKTAVETFQSTENNKALPL